MSLRRFRTAPGDGRHESGHREDAFTLVTLMILVTVLNVVVAAALPLWTQQIKREKEEELIFRGLQYAEAIRVFQNRVGRYPVRLEELLEIQPRSIRQLWKDPMTEDGAWDLVVSAGGDDDASGGRNLTPGAGIDDNQQSSRRRRSRSRSRDRDPEPDTVTVGPISGVKSKSKDKAVKRFLDGDSYASWIFTADILPIAPTAPGEHVPSLNSRWVGRPFPEGIEAEEGTGIDDALDDDDDEEAEEQDRGRQRRRRSSRRSTGSS